MNEEPTQRGPVTAARRDLTHFELKTRFIITVYYHISYQGRLRLQTSPEDYAVSRARPGCGHWISRASSAGIRRAARLSSRRRDLVTGGRVRASLLLDACRQLEDVAASRHRERDGEEPVGDNREVVGGRPTSRACVRV